jgi:hypothetical protein
VDRRSECKVDVIQGNTRRLELPERIAICHTSFKVLFPFVGCGAEAMADGCATAPQIL